MLLNFLYFAFAFTPSSAGTTQAMLKRFRITSKETAHAAEQERADIQAAPSKSLLTVRCRPSAAPVSVRRDGPAWEPCSDADKGTADESGHHRSKSQQEDTSTCRVRELRFRCCRPSDWVLVHTIAPVSDTVSIPHIVRLLGAPTLGGCLA